MQNQPATAKAIAGFFALVFAMFAFASAFLTDWGSYLNQPPPKTISTQISEVATSTAGSIKDKVSGWFSTESDNANAPATNNNVPQVDWNKRWKGASVLAAVLSILLAGYGFIRREDERIIVTSLALAGAALAYQFVVKGLIALAAGLLIARLLGKR